MEQRGGYGQNSPWFYKKKNFQFAERGKCTPTENIALSGASTPFSLECHSSKDKKANWLGLPIGISGNGKIEKPQFHQEMLKIALKGRIREKKSGRKKKSWEGKSSPFDPAGGGTP